MPAGSSIISAVADSTFSGGAIEFRRLSVSPPEPSHVVRLDIIERFCTMPPMPVAKTSPVQAAPPVAAIDYAALLRPAALDLLCNGERLGLDQVLLQAEFAVGDHRKPHQFE